MSTPYAFVARIEAKPDKADDVAELLTGALPLAQAEPERLQRHRRYVLTRSILCSAGASASARRARQSRAGPTGFQEVPRCPGTLRGGASSDPEKARNSFAGLSFGSTERRRSRTDRAWGCHAAPVLKV